MFPLISVGQSSCFVVKMLQEIRASCKLCYSSAMQGMFPVCMFPCKVIVCCREIWLLCFVWVGYQACWMTSKMILWILQTWTILKMRNQMCYLIGSPQNSEHFPKWLVKLAHTPRNQRYEVFHFPIFLLSSQSSCLSDMLWTFWEGFWQNYSISYNVLTSPLEVWVEGSVDHAQNRYEGPSTSVAKVIGPIYETSGGKGCVAIPDLLVVDMSYLNTYVWV